MKVVVGGANLGVWCRSIHSLSQAGDEDIFLDCSDDLLKLSTVNSSYSTYATVIFFKHFFTKYVASNTEPEKISVPTRTILKPYRTLKVAKSYLSSEIQYNKNDDHVSVTSEGRSQVSVTYKLAASTNSDEVDIDCDPHALKNYIRADPKVMSSCISNFTHVKGLAELTLKIQGQRVTFKNSVTDIARRDGSVVTEYNLTASEFLDFEVEEDVELVFGFRDFKIFAMFAEQVKLPVTIHFQGPADPVIVTVRSDTFDARLSMATRMGDPFANSTNVTQNQSTGNANSSSGRISAISSQTSTSASGISREVNRNRETGTLGYSGRTGVGISENNTPLAGPSVPKRSRIPAPPTPQSQPDFPVPECNPPSISITPLIEQIETRHKSKGYRALRRLQTGQKLTENEYLNTIPGHDHVLCPDSDEEA